MATEMDHLEELLSRLGAARFADEAVHRRDGSLMERVVAHGRLVELRADIARVRAEIGCAAMEVAGLHDSRSRRGIVTP